MIQSYRAEVASWTLILATAVLLFTMLPPQAGASNWPHGSDEGLPVSTADEEQGLSVMVSDGAGGAIIAWLDYRNLDSDIYAQRVDAYGNTLWATNGVAICTASGVQDWPFAITTDGANGAILAWRDMRGASVDVYAQRVDANGNTLWTTDGIVICSDSSDQSSPVIASDGSGGAYIAWNDSRTGAGNIFAQRIDASGDTLWAADGVAVTDSSVSQYGPQMISDGQGGAILAWRQWGGSDLDVYAQRLDADGNWLWEGPVDALPVCTASGAQYEVQLATDGAGGAIFTWQDNRTPGFEIYAQRIDFQGCEVLNWPINGAPVCSTSADQTAPRIISDGAGGAFIAWEDRRDASGSGDIYIQRVNGVGSMLWTTNGEAVCTEIMNQGLPRLVSDGLGGVFIAWHDWRTNMSGDIYAQRLDGDGTPFWTADGVPVCNHIEDQDDPQIVSDGTGGAIACWSDFRNGMYSDVYAQRILGDGYLGYPSADVSEVIDFPNDQGATIIASWLPSYFDEFPYQTVTHYTVWRRYLGESSRAASTEYLDPAPKNLPHNLLQDLTRAGWSYVDEVGAYSLEEYAYDVPTYGDSTDAGIPMCGVMVISHTSDPLTYWASESGSGYSVDNLPPGTPFNLAGERQDGEVALDWNSPLEDSEDLWFYAIYRGTEPGITPGGLGDTLATAADTTLIDTTADPGLAYYYRVSAVDVHGNEGDLSNETMVGALLDVETDREWGPSRMALHPARPNPFNPATEIRFDVPAACHVTLSMYDVRGARVDALADGWFPRGTHAVHWNGTNEAGLEVANGVYYVRMKAAGKEFRQKLVLVR